MVHVFHGRHRMLRAPGSKLPAQTLRQFKSEGDALEFARQRQRLGERVSIMREGKPPLFLLPTQP